MYRSSEVAARSVPSPSAGSAVALLRHAVGEPWQVARLATVLCLVIVAARALADGVQLTDERSYYETRSRDVLTANHPWLGTRVSAADSAGEFNHPGPLMFDLFALPVRLFGGSVGVTVGVVAVNIAAVLLAVRAARQTGGADLALATALCAALLAWTLGTDRLIDPWGPHQLVLPFFAVLVLVTAVVAGMARWLAVAVAVGSLCVQTHVGYLLLVPGLVAVGAVALVARWHRDRSDPPWRQLAVSTGVGLVLWAQPLWQQVAGPGPANVTGIVTGARNEDGVRAGVTLATRLVARVTAVPPAWIGPTYETDPPQAISVVAGRNELTVDDALLPSLPVAVLVMAAIVVAALWCVHRARASGTRSGAPPLIVAGAASVLAIASVAGLPLDWGGIVAHKYRYLWSLGAFLSAAFLAHLLAGMRRSGRPWLRRAPIAAAVLVVALAAATIPVRAPVESGVRSRDAWPAVAELRAQLAAADLPDRVLVDTNVPFPDFFLQPVIAELAEQGVDVTVDSPGMVSQFGERRRDGGLATERVFLRVGASARVAPPGARRLAFVDGPADRLVVGVYIALRR